MQIDLQTAFDWRDESTNSKIAIGQLSEIQPEWSSRVRLSGGWAFVIQSNGMSAENLDRYAQGLNEHYQEKNLAVTLVKMGAYWVMFGDLKGLAEHLKEDLRNGVPVEDAVYAPSGLSFMTTLMPALNKHRGQREQAA